MSSNPAKSREIIETHIRSQHKEAQRVASARQATADGRGYRVLQAIIPAMEAKPVEWFDAMWDQHKGAAGREAWIALVKEVAA